MRTMSACCFTEYAKSPGCAMLLIVDCAAEIEKEERLWKSSQIVEKRTRSLLQARVL